MVHKNGEYIYGSQLQPLLSTVRLGLSFTVEDLENGYSELCLGDDLGGDDIQKVIDETKITWFMFEEWYSDYFGQRDAPPEMDEFGRRSSSSGGGSREGDRRRSSVGGGSREGGARRSSGGGSREGGSMRKSGGSREGGLRKDGGQGVARKSK